MILSTLPLNRHHPAVRRDLRDCQSLHRTITQALGCRRAEADALHRLDGHILLVQSSRIPDWSILPDGYLSGRPLLSEVRCDYPAGTDLRFRLRADPVVCRAGKRRGLYSDQELQNWLHRKLSDAGCTVISASWSRRWVVRGRRGDGVVVIAATEFEGSLRVCSPSDLANAIKRGIGPGKAYGCGLLTVWRRPA